MKGTKRWWEVRIGDKKVLVETRDHHTSFYARELALTKLGHEPTQDYSTRELSDEEAARLTKPKTTPRKKRCSKRS